MFVLLASRNFFFSSRREEGVQNNKVPLLLHSRLPEEHNFYEFTSAEFEWLSAAVWTAVPAQLHIRNPPFYGSIILESQSPPRLNLLRT